MTCFAELYNLLVLHIWLLLPSTLLVDITDNINELNEVVKVVATQDKWLTMLQFTTSDANGHLCVVFRVLVDLHLIAELAYCVLWYNKAQKL